ncbi:hypothetical protein DPMN_089490 [Dreissena polymorpha]|uniref:Uncharacterized protein n=1 Tax=Dreissena polymorpha TaxID=45954 RepID=A0A9D4KWY7_DREPO|nr:hypothetical protein DPMN_089490 [Dreissena polymorpha]
MQMEKEDLKRCSLELALVMENIGVNKEMVSLRRHISRLMERHKSQLSLCFYGSRFKHFMFGSQSEGSTTIGMMPDIDNLVYFETDIACLHLSDCQNSKDNYFVETEPTSLPQCCCLQPVKRLRNKTYVPLSFNFMSATDNSVTLAQKLSNCRYKLRAVAEFYRIMTLNINLYWWMTKVVC